VISIEAFIVPRSIQGLRLTHLTTDEITCLVPEQVPALVAFYFII
jgi:hypothetical protein